MVQFRYITIVLLTLSMLPIRLLGQNAETSLELQDEKVIVGNDTVSIIIPEKYTFGRYDRELYNYLFIPKGQWALGLTASYGEFNTDDLQILSIIEDFNFKGSLYSINPSVSYFFSNNQSIGLRFKYTNGVADLNGLSVDFDEDLNFSIKDVSYSYHNFAGDLFYRNYIGLSRHKRFGLFNEVSLSFGRGNARFKRYYNEQLRDTETISTEARLNFSPGICVFIMDYVSFNVSFGVFGLYYIGQKQTTNGMIDGNRRSSGANFKFNVFNINFGLGIHI